MQQMHLSTDFGVLGVTWNARAQLTRVEWIALSPTRGISNAQEIDHEGLPGRCRSLLKQLDSYLGGQAPIPIDSERDLDLSQLTAFQKKVYQAALSIPMGETRTYAWIANKIQSPQAARAVGQALRNNPLLIVVPCHRVVGISHVGGYLGVEDPNQPEMRLKSHLLDLEKRYRCPPFEFLGESPLSWASPAAIVPLQREGVAH